MINRISIKIKEQYVSHIDAEDCCVSEESLPALFYPGIVNSRVAGEYNLQHLKSQTGYIGIFVKTGGVRL